MSKTLYLFFLFSIVLGMLVFQQDLVKEIQDNASGVSSLRAKLVDEQFSKICQPESIRYYPVLISCVEYALDHNPGLGHEIIEKGSQILFPDRGDLLKVYESRLFGVEGNYAASCTALQQVGNQREMTRLAEMALDQAKWDVLRIYLNCIGGIENSQLGASSHKIAELSYQMGKYYEKNQQMTEALDAYLNAARWYPTAWADPVLAAARILETKGSRQQAVQLVSDYLAQAQLPWSIFYLGRQSGDYKFEDGDWVGAYCAYLRASQGGSESPPSQVPERVKGEVQSKLSTLEKSHNLTPAICDLTSGTP